MEGQRGAGHGSNRRQAPVHCVLGDTNGVRFALVLPNFPEGCYFAEFASGVADDMLCACTDTHWQTMESMLAFVTFLDNKLQGQSSAPDPWVFVIDVAPVHTAYAFRSALPKHSSTSVAQPADVGVMKPFKDVLATVCGNFLATTLLDTIRAGGSVVLSDRFAQNRNHMPIWVNEAVLAENPLQELEAHCGP